MKKISVIIPTYKRGDFLERAIKSIVNQTYKNIELIIIDDNSNFLEEREKTKKLIEKNTDILEIVYLENSENLGGALSRNKGIEKASGEFIAFLDDDDEYIYDKLEKQINFYKSKFQDSEKGFVFCQAKVIDENNNRIHNLKKKISGNKQAMFEVLKKGFTSTGCLLLPKELLIEVGGFEKLICGQEWYLILKILSKGYDCYSQEDELLIYYEHSQERISTNNKKIEGEKKLYEIKTSYIQNLDKKNQEELYYLNNIELALVCFRLKNKDEALLHIKEAQKYKNLKIRDVLKIFVVYFFDEQRIRQIKKYRDYKNKLLKN